jgi:hypothetical protein
MKLTTEQLENLMVTAWEGGSNYWMDISSHQEVRIQEFAPDKNLSFAEKMAAYLMDGKSIIIRDAEGPREVLGKLTLEAIEKAFDNPEIKEHVQTFIDVDYDAETTDIIIQYALFNEIVYG